MAGRVRDTAGAPVAQARVAFAEAPVPVPDVAALTGPDGRFALGAPAAGRYVVVAAADGHAPARVAVDVGDGAELDITLTEERR